MRELVETVNKQNLVSNVGSLKWYLKPFPYVQGKIKIKSPILFVTLLYCLLPLDLSLLVLKCKLHDNESNLHFKLLKR